jgi:hypothetical protein
MRWFLWLLLAWPAPALIAGALGWKGIWGSGSALVDYLIPIPVAGGVFHAMSFAGVTVLLLSQKQWPALLQGAARGLLLGVSLVGALLLFDLERRRLTQNPVGLFLLTDGLIAQLFVGAFGGRFAENGKEWALSLVAALVLPGIAAAGLQRLEPTRGQQFVYTAGKPGKVRGDDGYIVHTRIPVSSPGFRPAAEAFAQQWHPRDNINTEDIAVYFLESLPAAQVANESQALLTYCMYQDGTPSRWSPGAGDCFDHETVTERAQKLYEQQDKSLPPDERSRLARAKACEGVRVPDQYNAISSLCRRK